MQRVNGGLVDPLNHYAGMSILSITRTIAFKWSLIKMRPVKAIHSSYFTSRRLIESSLVSDEEIYSTPDSVFFSN